MRDKNKLKKLLTLLTIGTIGLTPVAGVVACGTTQKGNDDNRNNNDDQNDAVDISVIENDLKALVESKTNSMWETTGENSILKQTLGGTTEYKDKTLSDLGIDVECLNPDAQADDNGLAEYNFQFTVKDSSNYLIAGSTITLTQNVLSSDKSYYSIYLDADGNKVASNNIPDGTTTVLRLGTNEDGNKFVSIPDTITTVTVGAHTGITSLENLFKDKSNLEYVDLTGLDTSQVTDMTKMFFGCSSLQTINGLNGFVTATTTGIGYMFANCSSLTSIDTTNWDTSKVTNIKYMFCGCVNLKKIIGIETWDMSSLNYNLNAFAVNYDANDDSKISNEDTKLTCPNLKGWTITSSFPTNFVTNTKFDELNGYDFNTLAPGKATLSIYLDADGKKQECSGDIPDGATEVLYLGTNTAGTEFVSIPDSVTKVIIGDHGDNITSLNNAFYHKSNLETVDFTGFDSSNVTAMVNMFEDCSSLKEIIGIENLNTSNVTTMEYTFNYCSSLTSLDLSNWDTSKVTNMEVMFQDCTSLTLLDLSNWDTSNVINMIAAFQNCTSLKEIKGLENLNTSNVTTMEKMFANCSSLTSIDTSNWDTSQVTTMLNMFASCNSLTSIDTSKWKTSNVNTMKAMFVNCSSLTSLNLSSWDTSKVTDISSMFRGCYSLADITGMKNWDMSSLTSYELAFAVNLDSSGKVLDGHDNALLNCPDLSEWKVPEDFDQSSFISSSKFDKLIDYNTSKAPGQSN